MSLKRVLLFSLCILVLSGLVGCRETEITVKSAIDDEKEYMKLYFNDTEVPVIWENNQNVVFYCKEIDNFQLNKIAARWPAKAMAQFFFTL